MPVNAKNFLAGGIGGMSFASCGFFFDFLKVRLQHMQGTRQMGTYSEAIKQLYAQEGIKGFTRGLGMTVSQDFFRFGIFFMQFRQLKKVLSISESDQKQGFNGLSEPQILFRQFLAGGCSSLFSWPITFPMDTLKTRQQTMKLSAGRISAPALLLQIVAEKGILHLYRGVHVKIMQAFPAAGTGMLAYESVKRLLLQ